MSWEVDDRAEKRLKEIAQAVKGAEHLYLATDPDREGEAISWHIQEVLSQRKALKGVDVKRVVFNEVTKSGGAGSVRPSARDQPRTGRRLSGAPRARLSRRLHAVAGAVAQAAGQPLGRPRAVGGAAPDLRARSRDRGLQGAGILDDRGRVRDARSGDRFTARLTHLDGKKLDKFDLDERGEGARRRRRDRCRARASRSPRSSASRSGATRPALHHLDPAAGSLAQARLRREPHHARRAAALRRRRYRRRDGRPHHLYAHRRRDACERGDRRRAAPDRRAITAANTCPDEPRVYRSQAKNAQEAHEAIRPTDLFRRPAEVARHLDGDQRAALRADLEAHRGEPDGSRR